MARLVTPRSGLGYIPSHRFIFDSDGLRAHFDAQGDPRHINALCVQFGIPQPAKVYDAYHYGGGYWPLFLELAERMNRPLDLSQLVLQVR